MERHSCLQIGTQASTRERPALRQIEIPGSVFHDVAAAFIPIERGRLEKCGKAREDFLLRFSWPTFGSHAVPGSNRQRPSKRIEILSGRNARTASPRWRGNQVKSVGFRDRFWRRRGTPG